MCLLILNHNKFPSSIKTPSKSQTHSLIMAAVGAIGLSAGLAQTLFSALQTQELKELCSMFSCETERKKLENTMYTIRALLLDVDAKRQGLTNEGLNWIENLKDVVYDVDDLLDQFRTVGQLRKQTQDADFGKKVGNFFSGNNKYLVAINMSQKIKMLRETLDAITKDHKDFGLTDVTKPVVVREETCSVSRLAVIGREEDRETIVGMLLTDGPRLDLNFNFVNIVGVGGLGKTTLAQSVYNDQKVVEAFSKRIWVCVSEVSEKFNLQQILSKILQKQVFDLGKALEEVGEDLEGKRYLLVLDDVWIESPEEWSNLKPLLDSNVRGSKVIVTTRSKNVATSIRDYSYFHELKGLSEENSWSLFKLMAFGEQREDHEVDPDLVGIGKEILKKCANVPLSIRVIASMLYDQDIHIWLSFRDNPLGEISRVGDGNSIMSTLMFSYYQLTPELKSCFSFCSLFPKDHIIQKELLINLWLAEGYLVATNNAQSLEDVCESYFTILLNRCFFQDIELDEHGEVVSFKMHDLMHDLAVEVAGNEALIMTLATKNHLGKKIRHLSRERGTSSLCLSNTLRTYVWLGNDNSISEYAKDSSPDEVTLIVSKCKQLRVLSLPKFGIGHTLSNKVGRLLHLRYLDLSQNRLSEMLPKSITKLHNLQILKLCQCQDLKELPEDMNKLVNLRTLYISDCLGLKELPKEMSELVNLRTLILWGCSNLKELPEDMSNLVNLRTLNISWCIDLKELPKDMSKLVNLRTLDISYCDKVTYMPRGMHNLTNLQRLSNFVVGGVDVKQIEGSKLADLQALRSLKGKLHIRVLKFSSLQNMPHVTKRAFILKDARLKELVIRCGSSDDNEIEFDQREVHEKLVEDLCPNEDIHSINMVDYKGTKMPSWASLMEYSDMNGLQLVTSLSRFRCLKSLFLWNLPNVEYMNDEAWESRTFFPVLEKLKLCKMPKLKGWWRGLRWREMAGGGGGLVDANGDNIYMEHAFGLPCFSRLCDLTIINCKSMTYFPPCPHAKQLKLRKVNEALTFCMKGGASSSKVSSSSLCLEELDIDNAIVMNSVLSEFVGGAIKIQLSGDDEVKSMGTLREGFERVGCRLKNLTISHCKNLEIEDEEEEGMSWKYLQSLSSLDLTFLPMMVKLPNGLRYLTSLQCLTIQYCGNLEEVGECIGSLASIQSLTLTWCEKLKALPECIEFLTSLQYLEINSEQLESLLESMRHLTSLNTLKIYRANHDFRERCRNPDGAYWPNISHIPNLDFR